MADATARARFVWHELITTDTKSAAAFFTKVVGWKTQTWPQNPDYTLFMSGGRMMAGLMSLPADAAAMHMPPNWLSYVSSPNVDETAKRAEVLGGKVVKAPTDIPTVGRFVVLQDPQGAVFAAFTPNPGGAAPSDTPAVGDFSWHELATTDWQGALAFYNGLFGWDATESMDMGPEMGTYQMYGWKGQTLGGMFNKSKQMPGPPSWLPYIKVKDSKTAANTAKKAGGQIINGPMQVPGGGWIAQGIDLQGAVFAVHSEPAAAKPQAAKPTTKKAAARKKSAPAKAAKAAKKAKPAKAKKSAKKASAARKAAPAKKASAKKTGAKKAGKAPAKRRAGKKR